MDSDLKSWFESLHFLLIIAAVPLAFGYVLIRRAGVRTLRDILIVEKAAQVILMNAALAAGFGFLGMMVSLLLVLFCDNGPASECLTMAATSLAISGFFVALSLLAIAVMLRNDDRGVWYLYLYPIPLCAYGMLMLFWIPGGFIIRAAIIGMGSFAMVYALAIRKSRGVRDAIPSSATANTLIEQ